MNFAHFLWKQKSMENNMNVSTVANGQYAAHKPSASHKTSHFNDILQERQQRRCEQPVDEEPQEPVETEGSGLYMTDIRTGNRIPISEEDYAKMVASTDKIIAYKRAGISLLEDPTDIEAVSRNYIRCTLVDKVDSDINIFEVSSLLTDMLFSDNPDLETRAANREAGKDMAKYIAENYFSDPEQARKFMDSINKFAEMSEARDKGYLIASCNKDLMSPELARSGFLSFVPSIMDIPVKPEAQSDFEKWLEKKGYRSNNIVSTSSYGSSYLERVFYDSNGAKIDVRHIKNEYEEVLKAYEAAHPGSSIPRPWIFDSSGDWTFPPTAKNWNEGLSWEMTCDPKYSMSSEENKAWYDEFDAKAKLAQSIIDNAKKITDFSSNNMWNDLMNLLPKAA
jgi:hypothetical protein